MSLDKAIEHKKEHRQKYRGAKAIDVTCRNHGSDVWCEHNRTFDRRDYDWENELKNETERFITVDSWPN